MPLSGSFACAPGELLALVGPSGAGKTSMLRIVAGLNRPHAGRVVVGGQVWVDTGRGVWLPPQARHVGLVFQHYALMPHLSALDNVALALLDLPRGERSERARHWLEHVQLAPALHARRPSALSGGQQQRVAVARALAREPALLLLDEPFSAVDQMSRQGLYRLLADLRRDLAVPIVLVTHDLAEARLLADRMAVIDAGRVLQQGTPAAIHRAPRNARVADLVGLQNRFRGRWEGPVEAAPGRGWLRWLPADASAASEDDGSAWPRLAVRDKGRLVSGEPVTWVLPGDAVRLVDPAPADVMPAFGGPAFGATAPPAAPAQSAASAAGTEWRLVARVDEARHLGEITLATLALPALAGTLLRLTLAGARRRRIAAGDRVDMLLDLDGVHVMPAREPGNKPPSAAAAAD
ncbi:MAG: ABC transporter ATP-binding protein [Burkholderiales bacterium]|nr:ABC transporter ATP-binding protein [Burkholderiales bacterium]